MTTIVCWNMAYRRESWRELVRMGADVALLQEPCTVPDDVADHVDIGPPDDDAWDSCLVEIPAPPPPVAQGCEALRSGDGEVVQTGPPD